MVIMMMTVNISNTMRTMMLIEMRRMDEKKARAFLCTQVRTREGLHPNGYLIRWRNLKALARNCILWLAH